MLTKSESLLSQVVNSTLISLEIFLNVWVLIVFKIVTLAGLLHYLITMAELKYIRVLKYAAHLPVRGATGKL